MGGGGQTMRAQEQLQQVFELETRKKLWKNSQGQK